MRPVIENLVRFEHTEKISGWYICCVLQGWHDEGSTFLTLAIDFGLDSYVRAHLTPQSVQSKKGRPLLGYILRPRFAQERLTMCFGNHLPDSALLKTVLDFGADPNHRYQDVSVWATFSCFIADHFGGQTPDGTLIEEEAYVEALKIMIQNGGDALLPRFWLSDVACFHTFGGDNWRDEVSDERLWRRFPNTTPAIQGSTRHDTFFAVYDLLEHFRDRFGFSLDTLKTLVLQQEARRPASAPSSQVVQIVDERQPD